MLFDALSPHKYVAFNFNLARLGMEGAEYLPVLHWSKYGSFVFSYIHHTEGVNNYRVLVLKTINGHLSPVTPGIKSYAF